MHILTPAWPHLILQKRARSLISNLNLSLQLFVVQKFHLLTLRKHEGCRNLAKTDKAAALYGYFNHILVTSVAILLCV